MGRCYIPKNYLKDDEYKCLVNDRNPNGIPNAQIKRYAEKMLDLADSIANDAFGSLIDSLPDQCHLAALAKLEIYMGAGKLIRHNSYFMRRPKVSQIGKICIALKCLYFPALMLPNGGDKQKV